MGKRSGSEKRILADKVTVRVDPELMSRIEYAAAREGLSPASWLRLVAAAAAGDDVQAMPRKPTPKTRGRPQQGNLESIDVLRFFGELGRVGNNINQVAARIHQANKRGTITNETFTEVVPHLEAATRFLLTVQAGIQGKAGS
jgi:hypothetical protein